MTYNEESRELTRSKLREIVEEIVNDAPDLGLDLTGGIESAKRKLWWLVNTDPVRVNDHAFWGGHLLIDILGYRSRNKRRSTAKRRSA